MEDTLFKERSCRLNHTDAEFSHWEVRNQVYSIPIKCLCNLWEQLTQKNNYAMKLVKSKAASHSQVAQNLFISNVSQVHRPNWIPHDRHAWLGYRWGKGSTNSGHPLGLRSGVSMCGWEVWMRPKAECLFHLFDIPTGRRCHLSSSRWQWKGHFGTCGFRFGH